MQTVSMPDCAVDLDATIAESTVHVKLVPVTTGLKPSPQTHGGFAK
jgi:hypothetical protein